MNAASTINEAQTEQAVIYKVLLALGWGDDTMPQVNLSGKRREDMPDLLLFANASAKATALPLKDDQRYRHGLAILEAKRWPRPADRGDQSEAFDPDTPSTQMLRYLSRAETVSDMAIQWGLLTNGAVWRLYWQCARSRSEEFFEIDLAAAQVAPIHAVLDFWRALRWLVPGWPVAKISQLLKPNPHPNPLPRTGEGARKPPLNYSLSRTRERAGVRVPRTPSSRASSSCSNPAKTWSP